ncbi:MFS transporter [Zavarzinia sp. CC-PAN008]|uniref:MFS transporter n=1 Tax=Zavarzinia sp. CC-PAN008 TaxID=3243332 RepID=UPI003F746E5B
MRGIYPGWRVVAAAHLGMLAAFGAQYAFAAFFPALASEFQASRADVALVFSVAGLMVFGVGMVSGLGADRFGPRPMMVAGAVILGGGLILAGQARDLVVVYAGFGLGVGIGAGFLYVPSIGAVQRWFGRRRGFASGVAVTGIGIGTLAVPYAAALLIETAGWRAAFVILGVVCGGLMLLSALLVLPSPAAAGVAHEDGTTQATAAAGLTLRAAVASRPFWQMWLANSIACGGIMIPFVHLAPFALDHGMSARFGALLVGLIGVGSIVGRFALGGLADRFGRRETIATAMAAIAAMLLLWAFSSAALALAVFAVVFGACYGGYVAMIPALIMDFFGGRAVTGIMGLLYTSGGLGAFFGPLLAGHAFDVTGSYTIPILAGSACNLAAAVLILTLAEPRRWSLARAARQAA